MVLLTYPEPPPAQPGKPKLQQPFLEPLRTEGVICGPTEMAWKGSRLQNIIFHNYSFERSSLSRSAAHALVTSP